MKGGRRTPREFKLQYLQVHASSIVRLKERLEEREQLSSVLRERAQKEVLKQWLFYHGLNPQIAKNFPEDGE